MSADPDRPYGRDYPVVVGICPPCGGEIETEFIHEHDDPAIKWWGDVAMHAGCVPAELKADTNG